MKKIACLLLVFILLTGCEKQKEANELTMSTIKSAIDCSLYLSNLYTGSYFIQKPDGISHSVNGIEYHECYVEVNDNTMSFINNDSTMIEIRGYDNYYVEMPITSITELKLYTERFYTSNAANQWFYSEFIDNDTPICIEFQGKLLWHAVDYLSLYEPDYSSIIVNNSNNVALDFTVEFRHKLFDNYITTNKYFLVLTDNLWKIDSIE